MHSNFVLKPMLLLPVILSVIGMFSGLVYGQGTTYDWTQPPGGLNRQSRMWVPNGLQTIKGILIIGNGAGGSELNSVNQSYYQAFAKLHDFVLIGTAEWQMMDNTEFPMWDTSLASLAASSGHPELVNAPWVCAGYSNGGQMSWGFNMNRPDKTIAMIANKGNFYYTSNPAAGNPALKTPAVLIAGETDTTARKTAIKNLFTNNRTASKGALFTWVEQEGVGHSRYANEIVLPLFSEAIKARYPVGQVPTASTGVTLAPVVESTGWLVDTNTFTTGTTYIDSYADYTGTKATAGWVLNEGMANLYRAFATYDKVVSITGSGPTHTGTTEVVALSEGVLNITMTVNTTALSNFSKVELFSMDDKLAEVVGTGTPQNSVVFSNVTLPGAGVHGMFALVTHADGTTTSTTNLRTYIAVPEPTSLAGIAMAGVMLLNRRRR